MPKYQGHKNWNHWNVSLCINNTEALYKMAINLTRIEKTRDEAARQMLNCLTRASLTQTPDGAPYSFSSVRAAMVEM